MPIEKKTLSEIVGETPELNKVGNWACVGIETNAAWPVVPQCFRFEDLEIWLIPHTIDACPGLAINCVGQLQTQEAYALLHRALSVILWQYDAGCSIVCMSGGNRPRMSHRSQSTGICQQWAFDFTDFPQIPDQRGKLALALMREARGLNHPAFAFLSFYRALETAIPDGKQRGQWITNNINNVEGFRAKDALGKLTAKVTGDIGEHLKQSNRNAIAHAGADPVINPDDPSEAQRLSQELPLIEELAVMAIEQHLRILTRRSIRREHLYELRGWKRVFGEAVVADIIAGRDLQEGLTFDVPSLNIRLRERGQYAPLEGMQPFHAGVVGNKIGIAYRSADGLVELDFMLNFAAERLEISSENWLHVYDDGSLQAALDAREIERFTQDYFRNGEVQMWSAENGELVARLDAFIPVNMSFNSERAQAALEWHDSIIEERRGRNSG